MELVKIRSEPRFIYGQISSVEVNQQVAEAILKQIGIACRSDGKSRVLLEFIDSFFSITSSGVYRLGHQSNKFQMMGKRMALVVDYENLSVDLKFYETTSSNGGLNCKIFTDKDIALSWLLEDV